MNKYNDKVKAGIAYLDQHAYGWRDEIDTESLSMDEEDSCILGQVYGDYFDALEQLGLTQEESCELGFNVAEIVRIIQQNAEELSLTYRQDLAALAGEWKELKFAWLAAL